MVWELLLIFRGSAVGTLAEAMGITDRAGAVRGALPLPERLLPGSRCFWGNRGKRCVVSASAKSSLLLEAPMGGREL